MEIHQVLASAAPGDAVTTAALELRRLLGRVGRSEIYARYVHTSLQGQVFELKDYVLGASTSPSRDVLIYHASIGEPLVHEFLNDRPERLVVYYHNISPAEPFYPYDPTLAGLLQAGRQEVAGLARRAELALAVSEYNARELREMGYDNVEVAPLVLDLDRLWSDQPLEYPSRRRLAWADGPVLLFVGQLLPHKRPDFLLGVFHVLTTYIVRPATLVLVGSPRLPRYAAALEAMVRETNLHRVILAGAVPDSELSAWYRQADVLVTASEHEGFCVPPVEAMAFGVPVVARSFAAVPETIGDAGLLLPAEASVTHMAEAVSRVLTDRSLREELVRRGRSRWAEFDPDTARATILRHLLRVVAA